MNDWNGFEDLDLTDVGTLTSARLEQGNFDVEVTDAEITTFSGTDGSVGNKRVEVRFKDLEGSGDILHYFNLHFPTAPQAEEIGKATFKRFLMASEHPTPDAPKDIKSLNGLKCGIIVGQGKAYVKDGVQKQRSEIKVFRAAGSGPAKPASPAVQKLDDEIPF